MPKSTVRAAMAAIAHDYQINEKKVRKIISTIDKGLVIGLGEPKPGMMCVEAAVCYGMGYEHGDRPACVEETVRSFKVAINDSDGWPTKMARAAGLRRVAIAQLGSFGHVKPDAFRKALRLRLIQELIPYALIKASTVYKDPKLGKRLRSVAKMANTYTGGKTTKLLASLISVAELAQEDETRSINSVYSLIAGARDLIIYTDIGVRMTLPEAARNFYRQTIDYTSDLQKHEILTTLAGCLLKALQDVKSPGCKWLYLVDEKENYV